MKNPKKLTRIQKEKLTRKHIENVMDYVVISEDNYTFTVQKRSKLGTEEEKMTFNK